jgi:lipoprotein-anchoring transpeptidase ErfK/SrfK
LLRTLVAIVAAAGLACAAAPASTPTHAVPVGVSVGGVAIGGLSAEPARTVVERAFDRSVIVRHGVETVSFRPEALGAALSVDTAVSAALAATPKSRIALPVHSSRSKIAAVVAALAKRYDRAPVDATVIGATASGPQFSPAKNGLAVEAGKMRTALAQALADGSRAPLTLLTQSVAPKHTAATFGAVIVISRSENSLRLFRGTSLVRKLPVATGQAIYPTPSGIWHIVNKQRDPWWYPPTQDEWAKGLQPVPPGPSNPLGTRWMGLNAPGVGIHGTDAPTSIGYSASHGCVRMQVPDAEWLFERVQVGTPVVIL